MIELLVGLIIFIGIHSVRIVADDWRTRVIETRGPRAWKIAYSVLAIVGLVIIVHGYGAARFAEPAAAPMLPRSSRHLAMLLITCAFVLLPAAHVPRNHIRRWVRHPMTLGVMFWAVGHLLVRSSGADLLLFGSMLIWSLCLYVTALRRGAATSASLAEPSWPMTGVTILVGIVAAGIFAKWLHPLLIGVNPLG